LKQKRLADKIKKLRTEKAWSQAHLAEVASLSIRTVQRVELNCKCSHDSLLALASAFDIDVKELTVLLNDQLISNAKFWFSLFGYDVNFGWLKSRTAFMVGIAMLLPALYFITASILKYSFAVSFLFDPLEIFFSSYEMLRIFNLISPVIFVFGLLGALLTNLLTMFSVKLWKEKSTIQSEISFSPRALNLLVSVISFSTLMIMLTYAFGENFIIR
jgi:transcriptional regulator with XRE-family HTH domain